MTAGQRYTPIVSGDVNGDGSRNDRAFIFNPARHHRHGALERHLAHHRERASAYE